MGFGNVNNVGVLGIYRRSGVRFPRPFVVDGTPRATIFYDSLGNLFRSNASILGSFNDEIEGYFGADGGTQDMSTDGCYLLKSTMTAGGGSQCLIDDDSGTDPAGWIRATGAGNYAGLYAGLTSDPNTSDMVIAMSGFNDANASGGITKAKYKQALQKLKEFIRADFPNVQCIFLNPLHRSFGGTPSDANFQAVREAQLETIASDSFFYKGAEVYDQPHDSAAHPTAAAFQTTIPARVAKAIAYTFGETPITGVYGPKVTSVSFETDCAFITVQHDAGTSLSLPSGCEDTFGLDVDGTIYQPSAVTSIETIGSVETVRLDFEDGGFNPATLGSFYSVYGAMQTLAETTPEAVVDNATDVMPLQSGVFTPANPDPLLGVDFNLDLSAKLGTKTYNVSAVTDITDITGANWDAATAGYEATYDATAFNNAGALVAPDNTTAYLNNANITALGWNYWVYVVEVPASVPADCHILGWGTTAGAQVTPRVSLMLYASGALDWFQNQGDGSTDLVADARGKKLFIIGDFESTSEANIYVNSLTPVSFDPRDNFPGQNRVWLFAGDDAGTGSVDITCPDLKVSRFAWRTESADPGDMPTPKDVMNYLYRHYDGTNPVDTYINDDFDIIAYIHPERAAKTYSSGTTVSVIESTYGTMDSLSPAGASTAPIDLGTTLDFETNDAALSYDAAFTATDAQTIALCFKLPDTLPVTESVVFSLAGASGDALPYAQFLVDSAGDFIYRGRDTTGDFTFATGYTGGQLVTLFLTYSSDSVSVYINDADNAYDTLVPHPTFSGAVKVNIESGVGELHGFLHVKGTLTSRERNDLSAYWTLYNLFGYAYDYNFANTGRQSRYGPTNLISAQSTESGSAPDLVAGSDLFALTYVSSPVAGALITDTGAVENALYADSFPASANRTQHAKFYVPSDFTSESLLDYFLPGLRVDFINDGTSFTIRIGEDSIGNYPMVASGLELDQSYVLTTVLTDGGQAKVYINAGDQNSDFTPVSDYETAAGVGIYSAGSGVLEGVIMQRLVGYNAAHTAEQVQTAVQYLLSQNGYAPWAQASAVPPQPQLDYPGFVAAVSTRQEQYSVKCPRIRPNTLYFAQAGDDTTGDGSIGNPYKSIAKANSLMAPDTAFLFNRGDVWEESVGLTLDEVNTTAGAYGAGDKPLFNAFRFKLPSGTVWTDLGGGTYSTAVAETIGWIRIEDDRLAAAYGSTFALAADAAGTGAPVEPWWFWSGGTLTVNMGGNNPTDYDLEYTENNQLSGVVATVDGVRIDNIRCDGYSLDRATPNHNQGYAIRSIAQENEANYITNCEGYYTSAHSIAYLRGAGNASAVMFDGCKAGLAMYNGYGGVTVFNFYSQTGGGECWFINCDTTYGALKTSAWTWNTTKRSGRGFFGHTSSAEYSFNLGVMYNCRTVDSGHTQPVEVGGLGNMPDAGDDLTAVRNYIVKCQTGPYTDSGLDEIYFPNRTLFFGNLHYITPLYSATEGFAFSSLLDQWHVNDIYIFDWKNQSNVPRMSLYNTTGTDNRPRFWDCAIIHRNLPVDTSTTTWAGIDRDIPFSSEEIAEPNGVGASIGAEFVGSVLGYVGGFGSNNRYLRLDNRATQVRNSAFFDVNQKPTAGFGSNYDNGVNTVTLTDYWEMDKIITPLIGAGEGDELVQYDFFGNARTSNTIGPIDYVASASELGYYVDTIGVQAAPVATNDNAVFHDAIVNKRYCFDFWTDFESFSDQFIYEEGGLTNGVVAVIKSDGNLEIGAWGSSTIIDKLVHPLSLKSFYRVVVEFNSSTGIQLYVNGVLVDSYVGAFTIGSHTDGGGILTKQSDVFADYNAFGNGTNIALRKIAIWTDFNSHDPNFAQFARYGTVNNVGVTAGGAYTRREMSYDPAITFSPAHLAKLTTWLDASDASTLSTTTDGANITQWNDKSSNNNHMIQDGVNNVPSYDAANEAVYFDRTNTETLLSTNNLGLTQNWFTFDVVSILNADISGQNVVASLDDGGDECCWGASASNTQAVYSGQGGGLSLSGTITTTNEWVGTPYVTTLSSISTAKRHQVNNRTSTTWTTTISAQDGKQRLGGYAAVGRNVTCRYHGRIVLARPVDSMELMELLQYARAHWGVRW